MANFDVGTVVHHLRYHYRGVIVEVDENCRADDAWYENNRTQPDRDQPWYHVFVDGGHETYVAQSNLEADSEGLPINHPDVSRVFPSFFKGKYYKQSMN
jgi:heat shock protein HspQ